MKTQFTSVVGVMTGEIKNNPSIYASKNEFTIFLNGELIVVGQPNDKNKYSEIEILEKAKEVLEQLKFGEFPDEAIQKRFDSFICE